jgi:hypothetical protein
MRKLMQLSRNDERQEEEDRDANGQRIVGLYGPAYRFWNQIATGRGCGIRVIFDIEVLVELGHAARINHAPHKSVQGPLYEIRSTYRALLQRQHGSWIESRMTNRRHSRSQDDKQTVILDELARARSRIYLDFETSEIGSASVVRHAVAKA